MEKDFFVEIEHIDLPWGERKISCPVFFYDVMNYGVTILAPIKKIAAILPSKRMTPLRITPWHCLVSITVLQYKETDIGPYNEVSISIPHTFDEVSPIFTGILRRVPNVLRIYIHHMPVTTQIALDAGVEFSGFPKFIADIDIQDDGDWVSCDLNENGKKILTFRGRKLETNLSKRSYLQLINHRNGYLLKSEFVVSERKMGLSKNSNDVKLILGDDDIANELKGLGLGKILTYDYCPQFQAIQTPSYESCSI